MKTVLFAIAMKGLDSREAELFEQKTLNALRTGSREFADATSVHCDYKEGLANVCRQYRPDCLIVNEALKGVGNVFDIVKDIKSDFPDMQITFLFKEHRAVGDVVLANLTAAGIYNWVIAPWTAEAIVNSLIAPKKMKDVEMYIPKIVENANGLAFDTKIVEKVDERLDDLPDVLGSSTNNAVKSKGVGDISDGSGLNKNAPYKRVVKSGFGFGKAFKPILNEAKEDEEETNTEVNADITGSNVNVSSTSVSSADEEEQRRLAEARRMAALRAEQERVEAERREREEAERRAAESMSYPTEQDMTLPPETSSETKTEEATPRRQSLLDAINAHRQMRMKLEEDVKANDVNISASEPEVEAPVKVETPEVTPSVETTTDKSEENTLSFVEEETTPVVETTENEVTTVDNKEAVETAPVAAEPAVTKRDNTARSEKAKAAPVLNVRKDNGSKQEKKPEKKEAVAEEPKKLTVTLNSIKFEPKFKKILFMRALPISSVVPAHICKLMNAQFVDFNKTSNNDGYFELLRTTIKEHQMPEGELVVGDVVAGNGVENLVGLFDHVIAVLPEDAFAIERFMSMYGKLIDGAIVDKCTTSSLTRKQLLKMVPDVKYIDSIKVDNCNKEVVQSAINHEFLMDNPEFAEGMRFFLKDIGGVEWI